MTRRAGVSSSASEASPSSVILRERREQEDLLFRGLLKSRSLYR
jgi:hypothetical protein